MLIEQISQQILLLISQPVQQREQMRFVPQHKLRRYDRSRRGLPHDQGRHVIQGLSGMNDIISQILGNFATTCLTEINVFFRRGSSSSRISGGSRRTNLPNAINPNA